MNRWGVLWLLLAATGALTLRIPHLSVRPLHNDEAVNAVKATELWQHGVYRYDPDEYHGPVLHYATLPVLWISKAHNPNEVGDGLWRVAPVVFGLALIPLLFLFRDGLSRTALPWAAIFISVSPAMVFYSRYFIHEMALVAFTASCIGGAWRYCKTRTAWWAVVTGVSLGFMWTTKETFVLTVAAMAVGLVITIWATAPKGARWARCKAMNPAHAALAVGGALLVWVILFSSFFNHWRGLTDSVLTYLPWLKRAGGHSPHIHPWYFYLQRLAWFHPAKGPIFTEGFILLLAMGGALVSVRTRQPFLVFMTAFTVVLTMIYSLISYKTPWCLLTFYFGIIVLAGVGASALLVQLGRTLPVKAAIALILGCLSVQLGWQAWRVSYTYSADRRNPYVYAQTGPDLAHLLGRVDGLAGVADSRYETVVKVIAPGGDYWPLPWYLRRFKHVGWYDALPEDPFAPVIIVSAALDARLDEKSEKKWIMAGLTEMRPGIFFELYVELELWKKFVETLPRPTD